MKITAVIVKKTCYSIYASNSVAGLGRNAETKARYDMVYCSLNCVDFFKRIFKRIFVGFVHDPGRHDRVHYMLQHLPQFSGIFNGTVDPHLTAVCKT